MKIAIILYLMVYPAFAYPQNFFAQKKTKLKYIAQQIALFKVYAGYLKKGYDIAQDGLKIINDTKHGDFDLHNDYFNSLKTVNATIKNYAQTDSTVSIQEEILSVNNEISRFINYNENIQVEEKNYINGVMSNLLYKCDGDLARLLMLTMDSTLALKDDERLRRIDALNADMKDKYSFAKYFENAIKTLALLRAKDMNDSNTSKLLYKLK